MHLGLLLAWTGGNVVVVVDDDAGDDGDDGDCGDAGDIEDDDDKEDAGVRTDGGENAATAPSSRLVLVHSVQCVQCASE